MRIFPIFLALLSSVPTFAFAQDDAAECTTLVVIQSQGCNVRRVFVCDDMQADWRNVGIYGPDGPTSVFTLNANGVSLRITSGPGAPKISLGDQADPLDLQAVLRNGADSFNYQMINAAAGEANISGKTSLTSETITIDGRVLQVLQSRQTTVTPEGQSHVTDIRYLYDADLQLLITDTISDATTGEIQLLRTPVDFIWPGEAGFEDYTPLYSCEG